jgi:bifunctional UDP-N-acetylglucosamine pyrophosphorylase/glucosamine-1-phosphate N-acetyltransferase
MASPEELKINEYNVSAYCIEADWLWPALERIQVSPKGEYYLTDLVEIAVNENLKVESYVLEDPDEGQGVNTRVDLADAETALRKRLNRQWMLAGVTLLDPATTTIEPNVQLEQDVTLYPGTHLRGNTLIGSRSQIGPDTTLLDTRVGCDCTISYSVAEGAILGNHVSMGPFCHLRKGAVLKDGVHLGNFGEVKESVLDEGVKMGHFSYIGNAKVGKNVNLSAGVITCNFDGKKKHPTEIGDDTFLGSDTMLVAPLKIGKRARTGAGSVVTHDIPDDGLAVGVPARLRERKENRE